MEIKASKKETNDFKLTAKVTVGNVRMWIANADENAKTNLLELIEHRFDNRYMKHLNHPDIDGGFFKIAICCLMIETLESFKQGITDTTGKSGKMFKDFFDSEQEAFPHFNTISKYFYENIRCGILHQAETTNAWRIHIKGPLLNIDDRIINASAFAKALQLSFNSYMAVLRNSALNDGIWRKALIKIEDICRNCEIKN